MALAAWGGSHHVQQLSIDRGDDLGTLGRPGHSFGKPRVKVRSASRHGRPGEQRLARLTLLSSLLSLLFIAPSQAGTYNVFLSLNGAR